jgi:hypothetical protein
MKVYVPQQCLFPALGGCTYSTGVPVAILPSLVCNIHGIVLRLDRE